MRTIDIARATGIAVNTVRLYEELGYLPEVPRATNGYRQFDDIHLQHILFIRQAMQCTWLGGIVRKTLLKTLIKVAEGNFDQAEFNLQAIQNHLQQMKVQVEDAIVILENWLAGQPHTVSQKPMQIGEVARFLNVSADILRNWERDGLLTVSRAPNGYRHYTNIEIKRLIVINALRQARYSTLAILRMFHKLETGHVSNLQEVLNTPPPDDDIVYATDRWLSSLENIIQHVEAMSIQLKRIRTLH